MMLMFREGQRVVTTQIDGRAIRPRKVVVQLVDKSGHGLVKLQDGTWHLVWPSDCEPVPDESIIGPAMDDTPNAPEEESMEGET